MRSSGRAAVEGQTGGYGKRRRFKAAVDTAQTGGKEAAFAVLLALEDLYFQPEHQKKLLGGHCRDIGA